MKVLVVTDQFTRGGADRVTSILCNELFERRYEVHIIADTINCKISYPINSHIPIHQIVANSNKYGFVFTIIKWFNILRNIKKYISEISPDIIITIASRMYLCTLISNIGNSTPLIVADHTSFGRRQHPLIDFIRFHLYKYADGISILTRKDEIILGNKYPQKRVIYNPNSFPLLKSKTARKKNILCAGRMEVWRIKGFDIILNIWKEIEHKYPDWILEIAGDCDKNVNNEVESMIQERNLEGRVKLLGFVNNMRDLYSHTSIFALSSRMEGFPMVLMEAMSQGCACVAFSVGGATDEMMDSHSGLLVTDGDTTMFKESLEKLISDQELQKSISENAIKSISRFSVSSFADNWESFIKDTLKKCDRRIF